MDAGMMTLFGIAVMVLAQPAFVLVFSIIDRAMHHDS